MKKIWEEDWILRRGYSISIATDDPTVPTIDVASFLEDDEDTPELRARDDARAKLAAQAPAMARLLAGMLYEGRRLSVSEIAAVLRAAGVIE